MLCNLTQIDREDVMTVPLRYDSENEPQSNRYIVANLCKMYKYKNLI